MKFKKPKDACSWFSWWTTEIQAALPIRNFLKSLPDEFEILGPGEQAVVWPPQCNKAALNHAAKRLRAEGWDWSAQTIDALATIAPEAPKKRMVVVLEGPDKTLEVAPESSGIFANSANWKKVGGPYEIEG